MASMVMAVCTTFSFEDLSCQLCVRVCVCVCDCVHTATLNLCMYIISVNSKLKISKHGFVFSYHS